MKIRKRKLKQIKLKSTPPDSYFRKQKETPPDSTKSENTWRIKKTPPSQANYYYLVH